MRIAAILTLPVVLAACAGQPAEPVESAPSGDTAQQAALERSQQAAAALGADLMSTMATEMAKGGPAAAIVVCSDVAQSIAANHSGEGVEVRRVTLKARNPANQPDEYERAQLERLQTLHDQGAMPAELSEVVENDGVRELRYLKPIQTAELCLACHGPADSLAPEVRDVIAQRYPDDAATGYSAGQLRGAISVRSRLAP